MGIWRHTKFKNEKKNQQQQIESTHSLLQSNVNLVNIATRMFPYLVFSSSFFLSCSIHPSIHSRIYQSINVVCSFFPFFISLPFLVCSIIFFLLLLKWNEMKCWIRTLHIETFTILPSFCIRCSIYTKCVVSYPSKSWDLPLFSDCYLHYWLSMNWNGMEWNGMDGSQTKSKHSRVCALCVCMCQITMYYKIMENDKNEWNHHWQWQSADDVSVKERSTFPIA